MLGVTEGDIVMLGVTLGVALIEILGVTEGDIVIEGVTEGDTEIEGVGEGGIITAVPPLTLQSIGEGEGVLVIVIDGVIEGVALILIEGVILGVLLGLTVIEGVGEGDADAA